MRTSFMPALLVNSRSRPRLFAHSSRRTTARWASKGSVGSGGSAANRPKAVRQNRVTAGSSVLTVDLRGGDGPITGADGMDLDHYLLPCRPRTQEEAST